MGAPHPSLWCSQMGSCGSPLPTQSMVTRGRTRSLGSKKSSAPQAAVKVLGILIFKMPEHLAHGGVKLKIAESQVLVYVSQHMYM